MEYMYNMRGAVNNHSFCPMTTCPMMNMQVQAMPGYMNYNMKPNSYWGYRGIHQAPVTTNQINPYFYQVEMKPVAIQEIIE
jgi:hypothetical protein